MHKSTRLTLFTVALLLAATLLAGCGTALPAGGTADPAPGDKLRVVATIFPQYDFVREIAGDSVELTMLLPPGSESHSFDPPPRDYITIENCDVFIYVGGDSDAWVERILSSVDTSNMEVVALLDIVDAVEEEIVEGMEEDEEEEAEGPELDEHVWTSPRNAIQIVSSLTGTLCALDAEHASLYRENAAAYIAKLNALDADFQAVVDEAARKTIIFADRFPFRYFADAYGLSYFAAFPGCSTETECSAATIAFLIDKVRAEQIPVVFFIEFSNEKMADTICEATGASKLLLHAVHNITRDDFERGAGYLEFMTQNVQNLKAALA
ncbi:MAG: metal ABC transporter substrate-binding protein [Oscillospiraceae bacterium]|nr:metal ABC transporter substrate-binding protein [Oscillospiraceae bacterium]